MLLLDRWKNLSTCTHSMVIAVTALGSAIWTTLFTESIFLGVVTFFVTLVSMLGLEIKRQEDLKPSVMMRYQLWEGKFTDEEMAKIGQLTQEGRYDLMMDLLDKKEKSGLVWKKDD